MQITNRNNAPAHCPQNTLIEVGNLIRSIREAAQITQCELAEMAGLGEKTISRLELGASNMRIETFFRLAQTLRVSPNELTPSCFTSVSRDSQLGDLSNLFERLTDSQKAIVYNTMLTLIQSLLSSS